MLSPSASSSTTPPAPGAFVHATPTWLQIVRGLKSNVTVDSPDGTLNVIAASLPSDPLTNCA
jgi:hypothetical protein